MAYRDVEVTPPPRPLLNWRPVANMVFRVLAMFAACALVWRSCAYMGDNMDRNVAEGRRVQQQEEDVRHRRCASLGGTWHEGFVAGHRSSWCSVVGR